MNLSTEAGQLALNQSLLTSSVFSGVTALAPQTGFNLDVFLANGVQIGKLMGVGTTYITAAFKAVDSKGTFNVFSGVQVGDTKGGLDADKLSQVFGANFVRETKLNLATPQGQEALWNQIGSSRFRASTFSLLHAE